MNIEEQPKLALLRKSEEDWAEFAKVTITVSLLLLLFLSLSLSQSTYPANRLPSRIGRKRKSAIEASLAWPGGKKAGQPVACRQILVSSSDW